MWLRDDLPTASAAEDPQPGLRARGAEAIAPAAKRPVYEWIVLGIEVSGLLVALVGVVHDFATG